MIVYDFTGRHAVVAGAGGGMGEAITLALLDAGASVTAIDVKPRPSSLASYDDRLAFAQGDLTDAAFVEQVVGTAGRERGGMGTSDDVGAKPRDRIGMSVDADGSATLLLTGNDTGGVVRLVSDGRGGGGVQLIQGDAKNRQIHLRTLDFDGEQRETVSMD